MTRSRFSESQIVAILKKADAIGTVKGACQTLKVSKTTNCGWLS
jgi:hypothetical protein